MTILTGDAARELLRGINLSSEISPGIYDYEVDRGIVMIDKATHECGYVKTTGGCRSGSSVIAIKGTPEEFKHLMRAFNSFDIQDMLKFVKEMP